MKRMTLIGALFCMAGAAWIVLNERQIRAQSAAGEHFRFEVATIKAAGSESRIFGCHGTDSATSALSVPLGSCQGVANANWFISEAYDIPPGAQHGWIVGGPDWLDTDRYAIEAKSESPVTRRQLDGMLQVLLHDRFKLVFHRKPGQINGFALVMGKNGPKLTKATGREDNPGLHKNTKPATDLSGMQTSYTGVNVPLSELTAGLSTTMGGPVIDKTGLNGNYNFSIPFVGKRENTSEFDLSIFTAIQDLGLRLVSQKVRIDVFVIDHVDKPTPD